MKRMEKKKSPLERLVEIQKSQTLPIKMTPKNRLDTSNLRVVTPIVEDNKEASPCSYDPVQLLDDTKNLAISNSSLVVNLNLNMDSKAVDKAFERSAEVAKRIAAAGAAMLGTALVFKPNEDKDTIFNKPKVNLKPRVKVPKFKRN